MLCGDVVRHLARSLARSFTRARYLSSFLPSFLCVWFFLVASTHSSLSSVLSVVRLFDALVRFLGFCCRFPAPLSAQTRSTYATLVFIFYNNGILLGLSPLFCFSLSLVFAPAFLSFSCSCCKQRERQGDIERACEESGTAAEIVSNPIICLKV